MRSIADGELVTPASMISITATATQTRSPIQSVQYRIDPGRISSRYATTDSQTILVLSGLRPGPNTVTVTMTDSVGNVGHATTVLTVSQAITLIPLSPITQVVTQTRAPTAASTATFGFTIAGEEPITVTPRILIPFDSGRRARWEYLQPISVKSSGPFIVQMPLAKYVAITAQPWVIPAPACWPEPPESFAACARHQTQLAWSRLISPATWFNPAAASADAQPESLCSLHLIDYSRCIGQHEQALWATLTTFPTPQPPQTSRLHMTAVDNKGQRMNLTSLSVNFNYEQPQFWRRLFPHRYVLLADVLAVGLLWLLAWWLWRRYKMAHLARYSLRLVNAGNVPCAYWLWAVQPVLPAASRRSEVSVQPAVLSFSCQVAGQDLATARGGRERNALTAQKGEPPAASAVATSPAAPGAVHSSPYDIHQAIDVGGETDPYAIAIGESPRFVTPELQSGESLQIEVTVRPLRRHWHRRKYTFVVYSEPCGYGAEWRHEGRAETIRFGGIWRPVRIDPLTPAGATSPPPTPPRAAARPARPLGAG